MKKLIEDYKKPTPVKWRKFGDTCLLLALAVEPMVQSIPMQNEPAKAWLAWVFSTTLIILKFWSNTQTVENNQQ